MGHPIQDKDIEQPDQFETGLMFTFLLPIYKKFRSPSTLVQESQCTYAQCFSAYRQGWLYGGREVR